MATLIAMDGVVATLLVAIRVERRTPLEEAVERTDGMLKYSNPLTDAMATFATREIPLAKLGAAVGVAEGDAVGEAVG